MNGVSLFSGGGIAETYFSKVGIDIKVANELLPLRAAFYRANHPGTDMVCGDITDKRVYYSVISKAREARIQFMLATPPCQGMSTLGKKEYETDRRNFLFFNVIDAIHDLGPQYVMIENVPKFQKLLFPYNGKALGVLEILQKEFESMYTIESRVLNAKNYGVPQSRPRFIIKLYKKGLNWPWPKEEAEVTLRKAIGNLPSIEAGEASSIRWHFAPKINNPYQIEALRHTPEGKSALINPVYYPKKVDGTRVKGFHNTYARMKWDEPAPARTTNSFLISGHNNVHPGRQLADGTWSDARVLSLRELIIVSSLPLNWKIPVNAKYNFICQIIGEAVPPLLAKRIVEQIGK